MSANMECSVVIRKGAWTEEEDLLLRKCIETYGEGKWHLIPLRAGLRRCRKSCRLRWLNYLRPNIKRGAFKPDEVDLIIRLHKLLGNRWSLIAGRIPGRTANDIKNYWNTRLNKKMVSQRKDEVKKAESKTVKSKPIKPQPRTFSKNYKWLMGMPSSIDATPSGEIVSKSSLKLPLDESTPWWESILFEKEEENGMASCSMNGQVEELMKSLWVEDMELETSDIEIWAEKDRDDFMLGYINLCGLLCPEEEK